MGVTVVAAVAAGAGALESRAAAQYVEAINSGDRMTVQHYVTGHYDPAMFQRIPVGLMAALHMASYYMSGGLGYDFHSAIDTEGGGLGAVLQNRLTGAWVKLHLPAAPGAPEKLTGFPRLQPVSAPTDATAAEKLSEKQIVARLEKCMHLLVEEDEFAGVVLLARNGEPLFQQTYGLASKSFQIPNQLDTKFNIASVGKVFTGVAIAQLAERGALSFEDPVSKYPEIVLSGKPEINAPNAGYGFYVSEGAVGRIAQHSGDGRGINAEFNIYLDAGYTLIVLSNYNRPAADIVKQVVHQMLIAGH
jgi:CubicO group peptidase (beta-lactamase class C family)